LSLIFYELSFLYCLSLLGFSTRISSMVPSHLSSATSRSSVFCTLSESHRTRQRYFDYRIIHLQLISYSIGLTFIPSFPPGPFPRISSLAPSPLSSATAQCSPICMLRIASLLSPIIHIQLISFLIILSFLSQEPRLESSHWHNPSSAQQFN